MTARRKLDCLLTFYAKIPHLHSGAHELTKHGIKLASAFTLPQVLDVLLQEGKIDIATVAEVRFLGLLVSRVY